MNAMRAAPAVIGAIATIAVTSTLLLGQQPQQRQGAPEEAKKRRAAFSGSRFLTPANARRAQGQLAHVMMVPKL
jgi:hypothetical protein